MFKRIIALIGILLMLASLPACDSDVPGAEYVGVWKAKALQFHSGDITEYRTSVIELLADGSGTYEGRTISWKYDADTQTVIFTVTDSNASATLSISQDEGKDVLLYNTSTASAEKFNRTYYRDSEYIEDNTPDTTP